MVECPDYYFFRRLDSSVVEVCRILRCAGQHDLGIAAELDVAVEPFGAGCTHGGVIIATYIFIIPSVDGDCVSVIRYFNREVVEVIDRSAG